MKITKILFDKNIKKIIEDNKKTIIILLKEEFLGEIRNFKIKENSLDKIKYLKLNIDKELKVYYTRTIRFLKIINIRDKDDDKLKKIILLELIILYNVVSKQIVGLKDNKLYIYIIKYKVELKRLLYNIFKKI